MVVAKGEFLLITAFIVLWAIVAAWAFWPPVLERLDQRPVAVSAPKIPDTIICSGVACIGPHDYRPPGE
jgi:hypothetical protein